MDYIMQYYSQYGGIVWINGDEHEDVVKLQVTNVLKSEVITRTHPCFNTYRNHII